MADFKQKRVDYINSWPNVAPFEAEKEYSDRIHALYAHSPFVPFKLEYSNEVHYNRAISFIIDALEVLDAKPMQAFGYTFTAYDLYSKYIPGSKPQITERNIDFCDTWNQAISGNSQLLTAFEKLFEKAPLKMMQYYFLSMKDELQQQISNPQSKTPVYSRSIRIRNGGKDPNREAILNWIRTNYSGNFVDYRTNIRKASCLIHRLLTDSSVIINGTTYALSLHDHLCIMASGMLYSLRNDIQHGSSISSTKSSMTNLRTFAMGYYAFMMMYYLLMILIIDQTRTDKASAYNELATNIDTNLTAFINIFGHSISE